MLYKCITEFESKTGKGISKIENPKTGAIGLNNNKGNKNYNLQKLNKFRVYFLCLKR